MARGSSRIGRRAAARRKSGGKLAVGRPSDTRDGYTSLREAIWARAGGRDEIFPEFTGHDAAHVIPRSQGGGDYPWNVLCLSRLTHRMQETPFRKGRLVFALGPEITWQWRGTTRRAPGSVRWAIEVRADKWSPVTAILGEGLIDLQLPDLGGECPVTSLSSATASCAESPRPLRASARTSRGA